MALSNNGKINAVRRHCARTDCKSCPLFKIGDMEVDCDDLSIVEKSYQILVEHGLIRERGNDYKPKVAKNEERVSNGLEFIEISNFCEVYSKKGCENCPLKSQGFYWCKNKNFVMVYRCLATDVISPKEYNETILKAWCIINDYHENLINKKGWINVPDSLPPDSGLCDTSVDVYFKTIQGEEYRGFYNYESEVWKYRENMFRDIQKEEVVCWSVKGG